MTTHATAVDSRSDDQRLHVALAELQATASNFAAICIRDARVRAQYVRDIHATSSAILQTALAGQISSRDAAQRVNELRNQIMDSARLRSSRIGRAYASKLKARGRTLAELCERYAERLFNRSFTALSEAQQASVYVEIIKASGRPDEAVVALARKLGKAGQRLLFVSLVVAVYEIYEAEDRSREIARQGVIAGAGIAGGSAIGSGAVVFGVCAATAPVCVGVAALAGGMLFAFGADLAFGTTYPRPAR